MLTSVTYYLKLMCIMHYDAFIMHCYDILWCQTVPSHNDPNELLSFWVCRKRVLILWWVGLWRSWHSGNCHANNCRSHGNWPLINVNTFSVSRLPRIVYKPLMLTFWNIYILKSLINPLDIVYNITINPLFILGRSKETWYEGNVAYFRWTE